MRLTTAILILCTIIFPRTLAVASADPDVESLADAGAPPLADAGTSPLAGIPETFLRDHGRLCGFGSRFAGQPGAKAAAEYIENELKLAGIAHTWRQPLELTVPVTNACTLTFVGEPPATIHPVWPNGANVCATSEQGLTAETLYIGNAELSQLPVADLAGRIAVLEFNTAARWQYAAMYGAVAAIFLPPADTSWNEAHAKFIYTSAPFGRFYVSDPALAERLRTQPNLTVTLQARTEWRRTTVDNILGFIPGHDPQHREKVVVLHCRYDASCVIPDQALGAEQAINPAVVLQLARRFAAEPPAYSILLAFVAGDTFELSGSRRLMKTLTDTQKLLGADFASDEAALRTLQHDRAALTSADLAKTVTGWAGRHLRNEHILWQTRMQMLRILDDLKRLRRRLGAARDSTVSTSATSDSMIGDLVAKLEAQRIGLLDLQRRLHHDDLRETDINLLRDTLLPPVLERLDRMIADHAALLERRRADLAILETTGLGRRSVGDYKTGILFWSFELSSHGRQFGPFAQSWFYRGLAQNQIGSYGQDLRSYADALGLRPDLRASYLDDTSDGRRHWQGDLPFPLINGIDAALSAGCLGMMFATTQDTRRYVDTPLDTPERMDLDQLMPQIAVTIALVEEAARRPMPIIGSRLPRYFRKWEGMAAVASPGESQLDLGIPDVVVVAHNDVSMLPRIDAPGVRDMIVFKTDGEGRFAVDDVIADHVRLGSGIAEMFLFDRQGRAIMTMNQLGPPNNPIGGFHRNADRINTRGEMFECAQIGLFGLYDPRYLETLDRIKVIDAARGAETQRKSSYVDSLEGAGDICVETDVERWQAVFARGDSDRRMLLLNASSENPEGAGFPLDWRQRWPIAFSSAHDFACLNDSRIRSLESTGVIDPYLRRQHEAGADQARRAEESRRAGDGTGAWQHANAALAIQAQVYRRTRGIADDTIHAVLFLLVGLVPFSYFVERLLIAATGVYRQIAGFVVVFVLMTLLVAAFHPAFRISITPITILLAFIILFLSTLVIAIVIGKFRREMERLREAESEPANQSAGDTEAAPDSGETELSSAREFKRLDVLHRAMLLGVANMRRRKVRTALTLATLVLLSFVIMSFTNPVTSLQPLRYDVATVPDTATERRAILIQGLNGDELPAWTLDHLRTSYAEQAEVAGHFWITRNDLMTQHHKTLKLQGANGRYAELSAVMCIEPLEGRAVGLENLAGTAAMDDFARGNDRIIISSELAGRLGAAAGDRVELFGSAFTVAAVLDQERMLSLTGLDGRRYAPVDFWQFKRLNEDTLRFAHETEVDADVTQAAGSEPPRSLAPDQFAIIPAARAVEFDATLRGVVMVPRDKSQVMALSDELASRVRRPIYANADGRVMLCAMTEITSLAGLSNIIVPLIISAMIILNTMLNCVYERQREIGILMSVGLAPTHVAALFVAEAAAYGTIGVVGGYILGQALGTLATTFSFIPGLSLNFSSSAAVGTQLAIMAVVLASAFWPARVARRIAAPGSESTWKLPAPDGDLLDVPLPFTMPARDTAAVLAYIHDWLAVHTESTLGRFTCVEPKASRDGDRLALTARVWLAPFDLGIMQTVRLVVRPGSDPAIHEVSIRLHREAGPHTTWVRSNRHFLGALRRQFLLWRSLGHRKTTHYHQRAESAFAE